MRLPGPPAPVEVLVLLDHGRSPESLRRAHALGRLLDDGPYGYQYAANALRLTFSRDEPESRFRRFVRRGLSFVLGFDVLHAWANRAAAHGAHVVWTHTEHEHLALSLLMRLKLVPQVAIIAQSIWLWDDWKRFGPVRKAFYRWLLAVPALHTTHSTANAHVGSRELGVPVLPVRFGVEASVERTPRRHHADGTTRVVALGSDRHRDWATLAAVARADPSLDVRVLSRRRAARRQRSARVPNFRVKGASDVAEVREAYDWADAVVVPLHHNLHASGLTVACEGILAGRPVVVSRTGGIEDYFAQHVTYSDCGDARSLATAIADAVGAQDLDERVERSRAVLADRGLTARDYGWRHVLLTRDIVESGCVSAETAAAVAAFEAVTPPQER